jgi:DNA-binding winged helix-turn-helix (wHTH) protein
MNGDVDWTEGGFAVLCVAITGAAPSAAVTAHVKAWEARQIDRLQEAATQWPRCAFQATLFVAGNAGTLGIRCLVFKFEQVAGVMGWQATMVHKTTSAVVVRSTDLATQLAGATLHVRPIADFRSDLLVVDEFDGVVLVNGAPCPLTPTLFRLVCQLARRPGETCSREELLRLVWGPHRDSPTVLKVAINGLRRRLGPAAGRLIETVPGHGYRLTGPSLNLLDYGPVKLDLDARSMTVDGDKRPLTRFELTLLTGLPPGALHSRADLALVVRPSCVPTRPR